MSSILIIDDEDKYFELCRRYMTEHEFLPPARNYAEAAAVLDAEPGAVDLVLLDVHFEIPEGELLPADKSRLYAEGGGEARVLPRLRRSQGLYILDQLRRGYPDLPVIVMTSRDDLPLEVDAERLHAEDYTYLLEEDYLDARSLKLQVDAVLADRTRSAEAASEPFYWGTTSRMQLLRRRLGILARGRLPVILQGATGTGKSLLAREYIHRHSQRSGPFVAVDLSTIPTELMAAHLFGVVKGAYTGATTSREGVLARAHGGTLFLDEIGNLSLDLQKSLLLVLQEGQYRPVGSVEERTADVKLVVATNEDLASMVREGRFREDLYMRLNPSTAVTLPSLRERRDDFQELLEFFVRRVVREPYNRDLILQYAEQRGLAITHGAAEFPVGAGSSLPARADSRRIHVLLHPSSYKLLRGFDWPGNFRQFEMVLSNMLTLTLVELVDHVDLVEPDDPGLASRPDVVPVPARTVHDLLRPMRAAREGGAAVTPLGVEPGTKAAVVEISLDVQESLNAVSCDVERQYLQALYERAGGDLGRVAEVLLGDAGSGRKVQLRMNQLGIKLRALKKRREA